MSGKYTEQEYWKKIGYSFASDRVSNAAIYEMTQSQLPGRVDGPADAYRYMLLAADLDGADKMMQEKLAQNQNQNQSRSLG